MFIIVFYTINLSNVSHHIFAEKKE